MREGWPIGIKVTLRSARMWDFLDRLVNIAIPRVRDFRGLNPKSFDGRGNYSMGVREQIIFQRSSMIKSIAYGGWTSLSLLPPTPTRKVVRCLQH
ncbi:hypothetical protein HAALTHF_06190n [Vreelandella aquamarina]|nr:hypothetical protein HAALTHF_06190n [Halomonas axialensis]